MMCELKFTGLLAMVCRNLLVNLLVELFLKSDNCTVVCCTTTYRMHKILFIPVFDDKHFKSYEFMLTVCQLAIHFHKQSH